MLYEYSSVYQNSNYRCILKDIVIKDGLVCGKMVGAFYEWNVFHEPQYYKVDELDFKAYSNMWTLIEFRGTILPNCPD